MPNSVEDGLSCAASTVFDAAPGTDPTSRAMGPIAAAVSAPYCQPETPPWLAKSIFVRTLTDEQLAALAIELERWLDDHQECSEAVDQTKELLTEVQTEHRRRSGRFAQGQADAVKNAHKADQGADCMKSVYVVLGALYTAELAAQVEGETYAHGNMIEMMELLRSRGYAATPVRLNHKPGNTWEPELKPTLLRLTSATEPGWYFFGLALHMAYHSVVLAVDRTNVGSPMFFWIDQTEAEFAEISTDVDGSLRAFQPSYGYRYSEIWKLYLPD